MLVLLPLSLTYFVPLDILTRIGIFERKRFFIMIVFKKLSLDVGDSFNLNFSLFKRALTRVFGELFVSQNIR